MVISTCPGFLLWESCGSLGPTFAHFFARNVVFVGRFWAPVLGPKNGPKNWASDFDFNMVPIVEAKVGHIFGSAFGPRF